MTAKSSKDFKISHEELMELCSRAKRKWSSQTISILKDVVVDGMAQDLVAKKYDVTQQAISKAKSRLLKVRTESGDLGFRYVRIHPSLEERLNELLIKSETLFSDEKE